jgi:protein tyrosine/serine phosphatase
MTFRTQRVVMLAGAPLLALVLVVGAEVGRTLAGSNFHTVVPGRCYRCAQPSAADLRVLVRKLGIRAIINLRGVEPDAWYERERGLAQRMDVRLIDRGMWAARPATEEEFRAIVDDVEGAEEPILIHCVSGIDRTGIVSAIFLLLKTDATVDQARTQLSMRFGHNPWSQAACQDRILTAYAAWLAERGFRHRPEHFRHWSHEEYRQEAGPAWTLMQ